MKRFYSQLLQLQVKKRFAAASRVMIVIAALLPAVKVEAQSPTVTVNLPGACTTGQLTAVSSIPPATLSWSGPASGSATATWVSTGATAAGNSQGAGLNQLNNPNGIFVDASGNLYVADFANNRVIEFTPPFNPSNNGVVVAGGNGQGNGATQLNNPTSVWVDGSGNIFVVDQGNNRVQKWASPYTTGTTVCGGNGYGNGLNQLAAPIGVALDGSGNIYVSDNSNNRILKFPSNSTSGTNGTIVAGTGTAGSALSQINHPTGIYIDGSNRLYVSDYFNNRVLRFPSGSTSGTNGTVVAGGNGSGINANQINAPAGVFVDCNNNVYVTDGGNNRIQQWPVAASSGTTIAGSSIGNSGSSNILLNAPFGVAVDGKGNLFVGDFANNRIQEFSATIINTLNFTLPGTYTATVTTFTCATGVGSNVATTAEVITTQPVAQVVCSNAVATFSVAATGTGLTYQWYENGISLGTGGGAYSGTQSTTLSITTVPAMNANTYYCQVMSTCNPSGTASATALLTVNSYAAITSSPASTATICQNSNTNISVFATGTNLTYQWQVNPPVAYSNLTNTGFYSGTTTNQLTITNAQTSLNGNQYRVIVNSTACPTAVTSTSCVLTVNPVPVITAQSTNFTVCSGGNATYGITASGTSLSYQWQYSTNGAGGPWTNQLNITPFTGANTPTLNLVGVTTALNGNYYRCIVTSGAGCITVTNSYLLTVNPIPSITAGSIPNICAGGTSALLPYSGASGSPVTYTINWGATATSAGFSNVNNAALPASPITLVVPGAAAANTYTGVFYVTNAGGCNSTNSGISLTTTPLPTITLGSVAAVCSGSTAASLPYSATTGSPVNYSIVWSAAALAQGFSNVGPAALSASPIGLVIPAAAVPATYTGTLTVTDANGCVSTNNNFSVTINANPTITLGAIPAVCAGSTATTLAYTATTGTPNSYTITWSAAAITAGYVNVGATALGASPLPITVPGAAAAGSYNGTVTVTNASGCTSTGTLFTSVINPNPTITLGANPSICFDITTANLPYSATTASPVTYSIAWGAAATTAGFNNVTNQSLPASPIVLAVPFGAATATYTGVLTVTSAAGCVSANNNISVVINPVPSITPGTINSVCAGSLNASLPYSNAFGSPNTYSLTWDATAQGVGFTNLNPGTSFPASPINLTIPGGAPANTYTATVVVGNAVGCFSTPYNVSLTINALPTISIGTINSICRGVITDTMPYTVTVGSPSFYGITWSAAAQLQGFSNVPQGTVLPASPLTLNVPGAALNGTYSGTIAVNDGVCTSGNIPFSLTINPIPSITPGVNPSVCFGATSVTLPYTGAIGVPTTYTINWSGGASAAGFTDTINATLLASPLTITVPATAPIGTYNANLFVTSAFGCSMTPTPISVTVLQLPTVTLPGAPGVCSGQTSVCLPYNTPIASPTKYNITWGAAASSAGFNPVVNGTLLPACINITVPGAASAATYNGTLTVSNINCTSSAIPFQVVVNPLPTITLTSNTRGACFGSNQICYPYTTTTNSPTTYSVVWNAPAPAQGFVNQTNVSLGAGQICLPVAVTAAAGTYTGTLTVTNANGCTTSQTITAIIIAPPTITLGANPNVCSGSINAGLPYTAIGNSGDSLTLTWVAAPPSFTNATYTAIPASPIPISIPASAAASTYNALLTITNKASTCTSNPYSIAVNVLQTPPAPTITVTSNPPTSSLSGNGRDTVCAAVPLYITASESVYSAVDTFIWSGPSSTFFATPGYQNTQRHIRAPGVNDTVVFVPTLADTAERGVYHVYVTTKYGNLVCASAVANDTLWVVKAPANPTVITNSPICVGQTLNLQGNSTVSGVVYSWSWNGCLGSQTANTQSISVPNANVCDSGDYTVYTTITQGTVACTSPNAVTAHTVVKPLPPNPTTNIDAQAHNITVCQGTLLSVIGNSSNPCCGLPNYEWTDSVAGKVKYASYNCFFGNTPTRSVQTISNISVPNVQPCDSGMYILNTKYQYTVYGTPLTCYSATPDTVYVHVNILPPAPTSASVNSPVCLGDSLLFQAQNVPSIVGSYIWSDSSNTPNGPFNAGFGVGANVVKYNSLITDSGWVLVHSTTTLNGVTCQSLGDIAKHITVKPLPPAPGVVSNSPICVGDTLQVIATSSVGGVTYQWLPINPDSSWKTNNYSLSSYWPPYTAGVNHLDTITGHLIQVNSALDIDSGTYKVWTVLNGCRSALAASIQVFVRPRPATPGDSSNSPICQNGVLHLSAWDTLSHYPLPPTLAGGLNYTWTGPNGFISNVQNPNLASVPFTGAGNYCVRAYLNGCASPGVACTNVVVDSVPSTPIVTNNAPICSGAPNVLVICATTSTSNSSFSWTSSAAAWQSTQMGSVYDTSLACLNIIAPTANMTGSYAVFAIKKYPYLYYGVMDTLYCRSPFQGVTNVSVNPTPASPILSNITYCQNDPTVPLTAIGTNILWYPDTLSSTIGNTVAPTPYDSLPGNTIWWATQTSAAGCTSPKAAMSVDVLQKSIPPYVPNPVITYCQGDVASLVNVVGTSLKWYTVAVGGTGTFITPTPNTAVAGTTVWYVSQSTNGCESDRVPVTVVVKQRPQMPVVHDVKYCQNDIAVQLTALGQSLRWYTTAVGGLGATTGPVPSTLLPDTLHYYVTETVNGCESYRAPQNVIVLYTPNAVIVPSKPYVCEDSDMSFTYFGSALPNASYDWGLPTNSKWDSGRGVGPIWVHFDSPGHKIITLIVTNEICKSPTAKYVVDVRPKPHQTIGSLHEICALQSMNIALGIATAGVSSYTWTFGNKAQKDTAIILSSSGPEGPFRLQWPNSGMHYVTVQSVLNGCASDVTVDTINVHSVPDARIDFDTSYHPCTNDSVLYKAMVAEDQNLYLWTPEHDFIYGNNTAYVTGNVYVNSYIKLQVTTPFGCSAADSLWITTDSCCRMNFPNAFTPNGDGLNDIFRPDIYEKGHHVIKAFRIANRFGQIVFESLDEHHGWDGKWNGVPQDMDTYYWYVDYICSYNNQQYRERGEVYLIR